MADFDDDLSASTARFQAFAAAKDEDLPAPWKMRAPRSKIGIMAVVVVIVAVIAAVAARLLLG